MAGNGSGEQDRSYGGYRPGRGNRYHPGNGRHWKARTGTGNTQLGKRSPGQESSMPGPSRGQRRPDEDIWKDVTARLAQHGQIDASQIVVEVQDGQVTLKGSVDTNSARRFAELAIQAIPGVIDVHDELEVTNPDQ